MNKKLPVLAQYAYDRVGSFTNINPYVIAFCYIDPTAKTDLPRKGFIIKGGMKNVEKTIESYHTVPMLVFLTFWRHGRARHTFPRFYNFTGDMSSNRNPWFRQSELRRMGGKSFFRQSTLMFKNDTILQLRRVPRKWLPEYTELARSYHFNGGR